MNILMLRIKAYLTYIIVFTAFSSQIYGCNIPEMCIRAITCCFHCNYCENERDTDSQNLMGIEIETSVIKIQSFTGDKIGFSFGEIKSPKWILEEDSSDETFKDEPDLADFTRNMELKSCGGQGRTDVIQIAAEMELIITNLYAEASTAPYEVTVDKLARLLRNRRGVFPNLPSHTQFLIKSNDLVENERLIRPQVTYQLSMASIPSIFNRLKELKHPRITCFMDDLNLDIALRITNPDETFRKMNTSNNPFARALQKYSTNQKQSNKIRTYFKNYIAPIFSVVAEGSKEKGFLYIFLYYWYELFNEKEIVGVEPGLKQSLGIMSRVPLSQLFDSLNVSEQENIKDILRPKLDALSDTEFRLRRYKDYNNKSVPVSIGIKQWTSSIFNSSDRVLIDRRNVDYLSPPPGLPVSYSMGFYDINSHAAGLALVEVRGYSKIKYNDSPLTIVNIKSFVSTESGLFFSNQE